MSACTNATCPCPNHRGADVAALPAYGIRLEWFGAKWRVANVAACLLPPSSSVPRYELARRVAASEGRDVMEADENLVRSNVFRLRQVLQPHRWTVRANVGGHVSIERVS